MFQYLTIPTGRFWSIFFNKTFRISYYDLAEHVGQLRINFETIWQNHVFIGGPPTHWETVILRFHMGIKRYVSPFPYGDPHVKTGMNASSFPYGECTVTNPFPYSVHRHLGIEEQIPKWEYIPIWIHHFHMGITLWKCGGRKKKSHMGTPRFHMVFVTIWGLTYIYI